MLSLVTDVGDERLVARDPRGRLRETQPQIPVGELGERDVERTHAAHQAVRATTVDAPAGIADTGSTRSLWRIPCGAGAGRSRTATRRSSTSTTPVQDQSAPTLVIASSCVASLSGLQRSSSSRNATQPPRAAATPVFLAAATPRFTVWRKGRNRGSDARARQPRPRLVGRAVVDDEHLDLHAMLRERGVDGVRDDATPVARRDDDRHVGDAAHRRRARTRRFIGRTKVVRANRRSARSIWAPIALMARYVAAKTGRATRAAGRRRTSPCSSRSTVSPVTVAHVTPRPPFSTTSTSSQSWNSAGEIVARVSALEGRPVVLPHERDRHDGPPARAQDAPHLVDAVLGLADVVETLDAQDHVEGCVVEGQEVRGFDIRHAVAPVHIHADVPDVGREQVAIRRRPAEDVEDVLHRRERAHRRLEIAEQGAQMEEVLLGGDRVTPRPSDLVDRIGRKSVTVGVRARRPDRRRSRRWCAPPHA